MLPFDGIARLQVTLLEFSPYFMLPHVTFFPGEKKVRYSISQRVKKIVFSNTFRYTQMYLEIPNTSCRFRLTLTHEGRYRNETESAKLKGRSLVSGNISVAC
ncbi:hypothetical protein CEXT_796831 [Caerostris extrusa]|uniref:Uncharacterized protein n=1 Tax=Caerostris extrusa TaxID=172846 RepID=A0AAV4XB33_CAEEX|nr:hypothetical protein CEXT_796831 [Caerostris extrusa]